MKAKPCLKRKLPRM